LDRDVAQEVPVAIEINGFGYAVLMATPLDLDDLIYGFLRAERLAGSPKEILATDCYRLETGYIARVTVEPALAERLTDRVRHRTSDSSCGLCGKASIDFIRQRFPLIDFTTDSTRIAETILLRLPERLQTAQGNFARTGGIHAAGIFDMDGNPLVVREDIGRHNAVDKAIGRAFLDSLLPLNRHILVVSGRSSFEIVQKALAAGIPIVAAVSAPSSLAINFARECGQTLIGFLRPPTFNVYSHVERIRFD
jgi:FdhD protein